MKKLLLSTALLGATAIPALAQDQTQTQATQDIFRQAPESMEIRGSDFLGMRVYATEAAMEGQEMAGIQEGWEDLGEINDIVLDREGMVQAVLVDIGGFLGIGERQVALTMDSLQFVSDSATAEDADDFFLVVNTTREALEGAPDYNAANGDMNAEQVAEQTEQAVEGGATGLAATGAAAGAAAGAAVGAAAGAVANAGENVADAAGNAAQATGEAVGNAGEAVADTAAGAAQTAENAVEGATTETEMEADQTAQAATDDAAAGTASTDAAAATATTTDDTATATAEGTTGTAVTGTEQTSAEAPSAREGFVAAGAEDFTADRLQGAAVYGANDERIGEVGEIVLSEDGQVSDLVIDVGGFLGIGEKPVAMAMDSIELLRQEGGEEIRVYVTQTEEELNALPTYEAQQ
ncbi:PRC-barrel domain containing protein [Rubellimicrobium rubrum]|uniref:PRC-barrel domain containing protein n=1 Tax=Rubellimicrobium rubrum TaxID=2585369 RepID=A0A5C4MUT9_9RHOB|nr:PRC-barrel domain-containing protein [Rubellimicrobium rubrum]TNC48738.1 PRC-barrel domain containing protein [Rubellimicrobium rubrum]